MARGNDYAYSPFRPVFVFAHSEGSLQQEGSFSEFDLRLFYRAPNVEAVSSSIMCSPSGVRIGGMGVLTNKTAGKEYFVHVYAL